MFQANFEITWPGRCFLIPRRQQQARAELRINSPENKNYRVATEQFCRIRK